MVNPLIWTEHFFEKHESGPYEGDSVRQESMTIDGEDLRFWFPMWLPRVEPITSARRDDLLFVLSRIEPDDPHDAGTPVVLVARRRDDGSFGVHVWHVLYPWALDQLTSRKSCVRS